MTENEGVMHSGVALQGRSSSLLAMACPLTRLQERLFHEYDGGPFPLFRSTCSAMRGSLLRSKIFFVTETFELVFHGFR